MPMMFCGPIATMAHTVVFMSSFEYMFMALQPSTEGNETQQQSVKKLYLLRHLFFNAILECVQSRITKGNINVIKR